MTHWDRKPADADVSAELLNKRVSYFDTSNRRTVTGTVTEVFRDLSHQHRVVVKHDDRDYFDCEIAPFALTLIED